MRRSFHRAGLTLVELLVAVALSALAALTITSVIAAGLSVWDRAENADRDITEALLGYQLLERDFLNRFDFYALTLQGTADGVVMATRPPALRTEDDDRIRCVRYRFDGSSGLVVRKEWRFPEPEPQDDGQSGIMSRLAGFRFSYYVESEERPGEYAWVAEIDDPGPRLRGVRVFFQFEDAESDDEELIKTLYLLPR